MHARSVCVWQCWEQPARLVTRLLHRVASHVSRVLPSPKNYHQSNTALQDVRRTFIMRKVSAMEPPGMSSVTRMYGSCFVHAPRNWTALGWCTCAHERPPHGLCPCTTMASQGADALRISAVCACSTAWFLTPKTLVR